MSETPLSLLERLRRNPDEASWKRLVTLYHPWLERFLRHACVNDSDIDDLRQEVLAVVVREMPNFEHNGQAGAFRRWMRNIVVNRLHAYWHARQSRTRQLGDQVLLQEVPDKVDGLEAFWDQEHDRQLTQGLLSLVEDCFSRSTWRAFLRQVMDGMPAANVAAELGISTNAALLAKSRVLSRLRTEGRLLLDDI